MSITGPAYNAAFRYDALGRRIKKTIDGRATDYLYDGWGITQEIENGAVTTNYLRGLNIDETLGITRENETLYYLVDALGSTIALTASLGNIATEYFYDPFGNTQTSNPNIYNPFQYTGRENDGNGHYGYRMRELSTELHRFISPDPIGLAGGDVNFYSYVGNNPVNATDPLGLFNPAKGLSALGNAAISGITAGLGSIKYAIAAGLSPASLTGVGSLPPLALAAWGAWNYKSSLSAWQRAIHQWNEALSEDLSQATWKNLYGLLPGGTHYDDPCEPNGPIEYIKTQGWWKFFKDLGYF